MMTEDIAEADKSQLAEGNGKSVVSLTGSRKEGQRA